MRHRDRDARALFGVLASWNNCDVDAEHPDYERFPDFARATRFVGEVSAGDVLFIPYCWLHYVRSLAPSISINYFFRPTGNEDFMAIMSSAIDSSIHG